MFKIRSRKPVLGKVSNDSICKAVRERRLVSCIYGEGEKRWIEPHCHGHSHQGNEVLSAYQLAEVSHPEGWKMFDVGKLTLFEVSERKFSCRPDFNSSNPGMTQVHCVSEQ